VTLQGGVKILLVF